MEKCLGFTLNPVGSSFFRLLELLNEIQIRKRGWEFVFLGSRSFMQTNRLEQIIVILYEPLMT